MYIVYRYTIRLQNVTFLFQCARLCIRRTIFPLYSKNVYRKYMNAFAKRLNLKRRKKLIAVNKNRNSASEHPDR